MRMQRFFLADIDLYFSHKLWITFMAIVVGSLLHLEFTVFGKRILDPRSNVYSLYLTL